MKTIKEPGGAWDLLILFWSAFVVFAFIYEWLNPQRTEVLAFLQWGDNVSCIFFLIDVLWRWRAADDKLRFWKWGWIDLLASIPTFDSSVRLARLLRVFRIFRIVRALRSASRMIQYFFGDKVQSTMALAATLLFGSVLIGGVAVLHFESQNAQANIHSAFDAIWWAITTITTVGYGDTFPVSQGGRNIGLCMMFVGITLFSINSALLSSWLINSLTRKKSHEVDNAEILNEVRALRAEMAKLRDARHPNTKADASKPEN